MNKESSSLRNTLSTIGIGLLANFLTVWAFQRFVTPGLASAGSFLSVLLNLASVLTGTGLFVLIVHALPSPALAAREATAGLPFGRALLLSFSPLIFLMIRLLTSGQIPLNAAGMDLAIPVISWVNLILLLLVFPLVNEFIYRKVFAEKIRQYGDIFFMVTSAVLFTFAFAPFTGIGEAPYYLLLGVALSFVTLATNDWRQSVLLHALANLFAFVLPAVLSGFGLSVLRIYAVIVIVVGILGLIRLIREFRSFHFSPGIASGDGISKAQDFINAPGVLLYLLVKVVIALFAS